MKIGLDKIMNTRILLVVAAAAVVATLMSCTREVSVEVTPSEKQMTFIASFEDDGTKTAIQPDGTSVWWTGDESINIFTSSGKSAKFTSAGTEARATAEFTGAFSGSTDGDTFYAVYPYDEGNSFDNGTITLTVPSQQTAVEGTFANNLYPSIAVSDNDVFRFYHVCGGARFSVSRDDVKQVSIKAKGEIPLAGTIKAVLDDSGKPVVANCTSPSYEVTLTAPGSGCFETSKYYYTALLPGVHSAGLDLSFYLSDGRCGTYSAENPITVQRTMFGKLDSLDQGLEYKKVAEVPETVDLGLSVKWASFNVGATAPEEVGNYYAWGETEPKAQYDNSTYKWYNGKLTKYRNNTSWGGNGDFDMKGVLDEEDDAAHIVLGSKWRMPSKAELEELKAQCTCEKATVNGVNGYKFTSTINGNSLFFPCSGYLNGTELKDADEVFFRASLLSPNNSYASSINARYGSIVAVSGTPRSSGVVIRPVYGDYVHVSGLTLDKTETTISSVGGSILLTATVLPSTSTEPCINWKSSDPSILAVDDIESEDGYGVVRAKGTGTAVITAFTADGNYNDNCTITVFSEMPMPKIVDMGLSVKWASCNLGASCPEELGGHWAWGETSQKDSYSDWDYLGYNGDAARTLLGDLWHMPTAEEFEELLNNCTKQETTLNGVKGYRLTSNNNGNSIFLPHAGFWGWYHSAFEDLNGVGSEGRYWSITAEDKSKSATKASSLHINSVNAVVEEFDKFYGLSIRPVYGAQNVVEVESIGLNKESITLTVGSTTELSVVVYPPDAEFDFSTVEYHFSHPNNIDVYEASSNRLVITGLAPCNGTVYVEAGGQEFICPLRITYDYKEPEPVDLGLSVKWASCNLGAWAPDDYGCHYAWGETDVKDNYLWNNYKFRTDGDSYINVMLSKYNTISSHGPVDEKIVLDPEDDAASVNLNGRWRMPTEAELSELMGSCWWEWSELNGIGGFIVHGWGANNEEHTIFIPRAGANDEDGLRIDAGMYWSSTLDENEPSWAFAISATNTNGPFTIGIDRNLGFSIRPVYIE